MTEPPDKQPAPERPTAASSPYEAQVPNHPNQPLPPMEPQASHAEAYPPRPIPQQAPPWLQQSMYQPARQPIMPEPGSQPYQQPPIYPTPQPPFVLNQNNSADRTVVIRRGVNHSLHLALTVLTCGMWFPIWLIVWIIDTTRK